jgi:hypothetical protein
MPDMSNLHEVQTVDMLPSDTNSQVWQVKLSSSCVVYRLDQMTLLQYGKEQVGQTGRVQGDEPIF